MNRRPRVTSNGLQARWSHKLRMWCYFRLNTRTGRYDTQTGSTLRYQH